MYMQRIKNSTGMEVQNQERVFVSDLVDRKCKISLTVKRITVIVLFVIISDSKGCMSKFLIS